MKFKNLILITTYWLLITSSAFAQESTFDYGVSIGLVKFDSASMGLFSWRPNLEFGPLTLSLDVNLPLGDQRPSQFESAVVRYADLTTEIFGIRYGILEDITFGYGLLLNDYSTTIKGGITLNNRQVGLRTYYKGDLISSEILGTWSGLYGIRLTERIYFFTFGQAYLVDTDGVAILKTDGTFKNFPPQSGYSLDVGVPILPGTELYAEMAHLNNHGSGYSAGFKLGSDLYFLKTSFKIERRFIESNFVPGYFNAQYEIDPVDLNSAEATGEKKDGYLAELLASTFGIGRLGIIYENYNGSNPALSGDAFLDLGFPWFVSIFLRQPNFKDFRSLTVEEGAVLGGDLGYRINPYTNFTIHYKKAYDPALGKVIEGATYAVLLFLKF